LFGAYFAIKLGNVFVLTEPAPSMEIDNCFLIRAALMDFHGLSNVYVRGADYKIVHRHGREFHLVSLPIIGQINIRSKLLRHQKAFATELDIRFLVGLVYVVRLTALAITGCHWWVMRHLLSQVLKVISDEFKSLAK
jgi:hypothetical protein